MSCLKINAVEVSKASSVTIRGAHYLKLPGSKIVKIVKKDTLRMTLKKKNKILPGGIATALPRMCTPALVTTHFTFMFNIFNLLLLII